MADVVKAKKEAFLSVTEIYGVCHEPHSTIMVQEFAAWGALANSAAYGFGLFLED